MNFWVEGGCSLYTCTAQKRLLFRAQQGSCRRVGAREFMAPITATASDADVNLYDGDISRSCTLQKNAGSRRTPAVKNYSKIQQESVWDPVLRFAEIS